MPHPLELAPEALRRVCDPNALGFETTETLEPVIGTVGQNRALEALDFGLEIETNGYNMFVTGAAGSGRATTVLARVRTLAKDLPKGEDWCYVHNFTDSYRPMAINLPPGRGRQLAKDVESLIDQCKLEIPKVFDDDHYTQQRQQIINEVERKRQSFYQELEASAGKLGLTVQFSAAGIVTVPLTEGRPMTPEEYQALSEQVRTELRTRGEALQGDLVNFLQSVRDLDQDTVGRLQKLDRESVLFAVGHLVQNVVERYTDHPRVTNYLEALQSDIVENHQAFRPQPPAEQRPGPQMPRTEDPFNRYRVNTLVSRDGDAGAPVVYEFNPTYYNLMGRVDYQPAFGTLSTDFRLIKPGALHLANGGYLIVQARDLLTHPFAYEALKRSLVCREVTMENIGEATSMVPTLTLRPDPIPLNVKVVLIGTHEIYRMLYQVDETFQKLFRVRADFDTEMVRDASNTAIYAGFVRARIDEEQLLHFDKTAVAKVVEFGSRLREHQDRLTTLFGDLSSLVSEASYWAKKAGAPLVQAEHVAWAVSAKEFRTSLYRDKLQAIIKEGTIKISTEGTAIGQINGLSVLDTGDFTFGVPSRITARVSVGGDGVVNVEREIDLSGKIHSNGVMILSAFLASKFAQNKPLSLSASLTFEQLYNEVDGDSASSTELYALLSALSGLPLRQDLAVTGSVNQWGEVQAVGGVQHKIEGFFDVCSARGLTGAQGVIFPRANVTHMMLREDVVEAVRNGRFHVYAVSSIAEGIEILTGTPAGEANADGEYPEGTVNGLADQRLLAYARRLREFGKPEASPTPALPAAPQPPNA